MVNGSVSYEKTDIWITFATGAAVLQSPNAVYKFEFPPGTLTTFTLCSVYLYIYIYIFQALHTN